MICWARGSAVAAILGFGAISLMDIAALAEPGVFDDRILFGQSAAFEGPAAALGLGMREGILASFNEANAAGGVNGRRLELVSYDDSYEPEKAITNTKRLIGENGVFALVGEVGTPHFQRGAADHHGSGGAVYRAVHRRCLLAQPVARQRDQRSRLV